MGSVKMNHTKFIRLMIQADSLKDQIKAYRAVFPGCKNDSAARAASYRLLQNVEISEAIEKGKREREETIQLAKKEERIRLAKEQVASEFEVDAVVSSIVMGSHRRNKRYRVMNPKTKKFNLITVKEEPTESDKLQAALLLYRRKGSLAPTSVKHEAGDSFLDFMKQVSTIDNKIIPNDIGQ